jgi:hypothetical protein
LLFLTILQTACLEADVVVIFRALVKFLYDEGMDMLDEDPIRTW